MLQPVTTCGSVNLFTRPQVLSNSTRHHKFFYRSQCVTNAHSSAAAQPAAAATEGGLFNSINGFGSIRRLLSQLMGSHSLHSAAACFSGAQVRQAKGQMVGGLTWTHTEDLVKVSADAHLLVELWGLGQVGAGFKVRHGEDVGPSLAGSCKWTRT